MYEGYSDKKPMRAGQQQNLSGQQDKMIAPTLISGIDQTKLALGIDTSHWNGPLTPALINGADFVCPKATDGSQVQKGNWGDLGTFVDDQFHNTVQLCYDPKKPCIPYHFFQWNYDQWNIDQTYKFQYDIIKNAFRNLKPHVSYHGLALDLETPGDTSTNYQKRVQGLYSLLKADPQFSDIPIFFYTSNYYLNMYPALRDWLSYQGCDKLLWLAQWPYTAKWSGTWEQFRKEVLPSVNMKVITPGYASWSLVQWSASCTVEGFNVDVNSACRSKEEFYEWLNFSQVDTTPPLPPAALTASLSGYSVFLTWAASQDATKYKVYRDGGCLGEALATAYTDSGTIPGVAYTYCVTALDQAGNESGPSNVVLAQVPGQEPPPGDLEGRVQDLEIWKAQVTAFFAGK